MGYTHTQAEELVTKSKKGPRLPLLCLQYHHLQTRTSAWRPATAYLKYIKCQFFWVRIFFSCFLLSISETHSKNCSPMGVIFCISRMASDIFLHLPHSADRPFGVKNTQSLCIMFLNFFASLSYAFPDLMIMLSKLGARTLWPPDVEILPQACLRTSLKWQCVCEIIMWTVLVLFFILVTEGYC